MRYLFLLLFALLTTLSAASQQIDSVRIFSAAMNKEVNALVIKPSNYNVTRQAFPVVYLLHGYAGRETDWLSIVPPVKYLSNSTGCIIVCADAGNSWYLNSPSLPGSLYSTFMARELVHTIDSIYRTIPHPKKRAITGLSMGGHGALMLAINNPGVYGAAGSMSGGLDLRPFMKQFELGKVIADTSVTGFNWKNYSVLQMADSTNTKHLKLLIDCGVDDFFLEANRSVHQKLLNQHIPHEYVERPGGHTWKYWGNAVDHHFLFFRKYFNEGN